MPLDPGFVLATAVAAVIVGILLGRRTGRPRERIRELEAQLEAVGKERELAHAAVEAAKAEIRRVTTELDEYRRDVVEHFTGTSGVLRDLTHQYRAVYDHLTTGATSLCPEGSIDLLEGLRSEKLPDGKDFASGDEGSEGEPPASETDSPEA